MSLVERVSLVVAAGRVIWNGLGSGRGGGGRWWRAAAVSAWGAPRLDDTASEDSVCLVSGSVDGDTAPEDGVSPVELHSVAPVVVVGTTSVACSYCLSGPSGSGELVSGGSASAAQVTKLVDLEGMETCLGSKSAHVAGNPNVICEVAIGWSIELKPSPSHGVLLVLKEHIGTQVL